VIHFIRRYADLVLVCGLALVFTLWPEIDLMLTEAYYRPGVGFPLNDAWWVQLVYHIVGHLWIVAFVWLLLLLIGLVPRFKRHWATRRLAIAYLLTALLIGPGLIVHPLLKEHWGRARPRNVVEFGGTAQFTPPLQPADECRRNCSFVSGHAAAGFYPMAGYWVTRRRRWLVGGIALGSLAGYIRVAMGAHFLSDVLFAGVIVHFTCRGLAYVFRLPKDLTKGKKQYDERASVPAANN
jgi:lipid A 4'-phosphatase